MRFRGLIAAMMTVASVLVVGCEKKITDEGTDYYIEAVNVRNAGDTAEAMQLYGKSIETKPTPWAYYDRARTDP